jgi:hypothetical protein
LLVEGGDVALLKAFQDKLFPSSDTPVDTIPNAAIGGWGGWQRVIGSQLAMRSTGEDRILCYCILDSDYHEESEIAERLSEAASHKINLHVWLSKEIENYLLCPHAISRLIADRSGMAVETRPSAQVIRNQIGQLCESMRTDTSDAIADSYLARHRAVGVTGANRYARGVIDRAWETEDGKLRLVSGKQLLSTLTQWSQDQYGVSFGPMSLCQRMSADEVPPEVQMVIKSIEGQCRFQRG